MPEFTPTPPPDRKPMELIQGHPLPPLEIAPTSLMGIIRPDSVNTRPPNINRKSRVYQLRLTPAQWTELTRKATFDRKTVADFIRSRCGI